MRGRRRFACAPHSSVARPLIRPRLARPPSPARGEGSWCRHACPAQPPRHRPPRRLRRTARAHAHRL
ncbi:MAG: hypothetical protein EON91_01170 [Brevundimonas sp.]|nr:MAG: hypothetical protein EON91_01170 [Brevundimonas sp.]